MDFFINIWKGFCRLLLQLLISCNNHHVPHRLQFLISSKHYQLQFQLILLIFWGRFRQQLLMLQYLLQFLIFLGHFRLPNQLQLLIFLILTQQFLPKPVTFWGRFQLQMGSRGNSKDNILSSRGKRNRGSTSTTSIKFYSIYYGQFKNNFGLVIF